MRLVYLSPVPWASFAQRSHKFVRWWHGRSSDRVLWIDPYPTRLPRLADFLRARPREVSVHDGIPDWLTVLQPRALPVESLPSLSWVNRLFWGKVLDTVSAFASQGSCPVGIGKPSALALQVLENTPDAFSFYDAMDDFPAFYTGLSRLAMERRERELSNRVNKILVSSSGLRSRFAHYGEKVIMALNACSIGSLPPVEALLLRPTRPILGYVGTIGHWFDWPLVIAIARQNPKASLRLIGPNYVPPSESLPRNIELLPPCSHAQAIQAMMHFSVGLIPFKRNDLTASVDPIKYYEYRALGLPVVSTLFGEMTHRRREPGVFFIEEDTDLNHIIETALAYHCDREEIQAFRDKNNWEARFAASSILP